MLADAANPRGGTGEPMTQLYLPRTFKRARESQRPIRLGYSGHGAGKTETHHASLALVSSRWETLYFSCNQPYRRRPEKNGIYFASVDSTEMRFVVATDAAAQYASGYLLYRSNTALVAQPFDPESGELSGSPVPLINNVRFDSGVWRDIFAVSQNGRILYQAGDAAVAGTRLVWFDRNGKELGAVNDRAYTTIDLRLSPDGKRVAYVTGNGIWTIDLERKTSTRITFDQQTAFQPSWSPDGKSVIFVANQTQGGGNVEIRSKASDGSGPEKIWSRQTTIIFRDGRRMENI